jgi:TPR repeat protein
VEILQKGCDDGSARACGQVGWLHARGLGTPKDISRAMRSYEQGCQGSDAAACYDLAVTRASTRADDPSVPTLLERACGLGLPQACMEQCSRLVRGDVSDPGHASSVCERACNQGIAVGCTYLGACYERGQGLPADREKAAALYKQGCEGKDPAGCQNLARLSR